MIPEQGEGARPARVGPYRLESRLGSGGMGAVWRAWDERLKRQVAIKHIRADARLPELRQRLWREAHVFQSVILEGKTHLTAISSNGAPPLYITSIVKFIDAYDTK